MVPKSQWEYWGIFRVWSSLLFFSSSSLHGKNGALQLMLNLCSHNNFSSIFWQVADFSFFIYGLEDLSNFSLNHCIFSIFLLFMFYFISHSVYIFLFFKWESLFIYLFILFAIICWTKGTKRNKKELWNR